MSEENNTNKVHDRVSKVLDKFDEHKRMTLDELAKLKRELNDALQGTSTVHSQERDELRSAIDDIKKWIDKREQEDDEKKKHHNSSTTMVTPPDDVTPRSAPSSEPTHEPPSGEKKRSLFKSLW